MNRELTDEELLVATDEEWAMYKEFTEGLPSMAGKNNDGKDKFGQYIPYHSGPHIIRHIKNTIDIVKPYRILEIGFNMGHSASMWLNLSDAHLDSIDVSLKDETAMAAALLEDRFGKPIVRFEYFHRSLYDSTAKYYNLIFIDGAHDDENITTDIQLAKDLEIPYILFDDWYPRFGETQKSVAKFPDLELVEDMNNLRLYRWKS